MVWFIVLASLAAVCGIGYLFLPVLKKMKGIKPSNKAKDNKEVKKSIRADKKQQKDKCSRFVHKIKSSNWYTFKQKESLYGRM